MLNRLVIVVAVGWLVASCGGSGGGTDGGGTGTAGTGGGNGTITLGQICDSTGMAFCNRVMACGQAIFAECFAAYQPACCGGAVSCTDVVTGMTAARLAAYETSCDAAFKAEACADVAVGTVPAACSMVP